MRAFVNKLIGKDSAALGQLVRFGIVGVSVNVLLYVIYLALTSFGTGHKTAATLVYFGGVVVNFFAHKKITFTDKGKTGRQLGPFAVIVAVCYGVTIGGQYLLVDIMKAPHQIVQAALIVLCAIISFVLQKFWVFRKET